MPDLAAISPFLGSIKTATELAKAIKGADLSLEKAETKLKMAELISALADAKIQAAEIQDLLLEKEAKIKELERSLEKKSTLIRHKGMYFESDENGNPVGEPFCSNCWESKNKAVHLDTIGGSLHKCPSCKNVLV
ncbi:MAG: hypothetical protein M3384_09790 [Acidobacteriota bacterium]|nr:hypothetical protein [Acidobacteriota bacterium]